MKDQTMRATFFDDERALEPADLSILQKVFNEICKLRSLDRAGNEAADLAATIIGLHKAGYRSSDELHHMLAR